MAAKPFYADYVNRLMRWVLSSDGGREGSELRELTR